MQRNKSGLKMAGLLTASLFVAACSSGNPEDLRRELGIGAGLPTAYPLLPGDAARWQTMNAEQRERALLFLQDGGTIASSLKPD